MIDKFTFLIVNINEKMTPKFPFIIIQQTLFSFVLLQTVTKQMLQSTTIKAISVYIDLFEFLGSHSQTFSIILLLLQLFTFLLFIFQLYKQIALGFLAFLWQFHTQILIFIILEYTFSTLHQIDIITILLALLFYVFFTYYTLNLDKIAVNMFWDNITQGLLIMITILTGLDFSLKHLLVQALLLSYDSAKLLFLYYFKICDNLQLSKFQSTLSMVRWALCLTFMVQTEFNMLFIFLLIPIMMKVNQCTFDICIIQRLSGCALDLASDNVSSLLNNVNFVLMIEESGHYGRLFFSSFFKYKHKLNCDKLSCFCEKNDYISDVEMQLKSMFETNNQLQILIGLIIESKIDYKIFGRLSYEEIQELIFILNRIHSLQKPNRLFNTLIREQMLMKFSKNEMYRLSALTIRKQRNQKLIYNSLKTYINNPHLDSSALMQYYSLFDKSIVILLELCIGKREILQLLQFNYQNPQYYYLNELSERYFENAQTFESIFMTLLTINPRSIAIKNMVVVFYHQISNQPKKLSEFKHLIKETVNGEYWDLLNRRQTSFVIASWAQDNLVITQHSALFTTLMEGIDIVNVSTRSELIGRPIETIIAGPVQLRHKQYVDRLIKVGHPRLLNKGFYDFYLKTLTGYMKETHTLTRLGNSMQQLQFMAILSYVENDAAKVLLDEAGIVLSYSKEAATQLRLDDAIIRILGVKQSYRNLSKKQLKSNVQILMQNVHLINLKKGIPQIHQVSYNELQNGLILVPKIQLRNKLNEEDKSLHELNMFKYYLEHPKKCFVFSATFNLIQNCHSDGDLIYETLNVYNCKELRDIDLKMFSLELMLKQTMNSSQVFQSAYMTSYTSYKSLRSQVRLIACTSESNLDSYRQEEQQNQQQEQKDQQEWQEEQFIVENDSLNAKKFPATLPIKAFPGDSSLIDKEFEVERLEDSEVPVINICCSVAQSHYSQDFLLSNRTTFRDKGEETQQLMPTIIKTQQLQKETSQSPECSDSEIEEEPKELHKFEINMAGVTDLTLKQEVEWIRSKIKGQVKTQVWKEQKRIYQRNYTEQDQVSSIVTEDNSNNSSLVHHIVTNILNTQPQQLIKLYFISIVLILAILGLIIGNHSLVTHNYEHMFIDSTNRQYPLNLMQDINLMQIAIQKISLLHESNRTNANLKIILDYYKVEAYKEYVESTLLVNYYENDYHDFLIYMDSIWVTIKSTYSDTDKTIIEQSFRMRYFIVQYMMQIMFTISETPLDEIQTHSMHESVISLNYIFFLEKMQLLIYLTTKEVLDRIDVVQTIIIQFLVSGLSIGFSLCLAFSYSLYLTLQWRNSIMQTYFLFQGIQSQIDELDEQVQQMMQIEDFIQYSYQPKKLDKSGILFKKSLQQSSNTTIKKSFICNIFTSMFILLILIIGYFIPFSIFFTIESNQAVNTNQLISQLGMAELAFSTQLTVFLSKAISIISPDYSHTYIAELETQYNYLQESFDQAENFFIYQLPQDPIYMTNANIKQVTEFTEGNFCNLFPNIVRPLDICEEVADGILTRGYTRYLSYAQTKLDIWKAEIFQNSNSTRSLEVIAQNQDFNDVIMSYSFIFPLIKQIKADLIEALRKETEVVLGDSRILTGCLTTFVILMDLIIFSRILRLFRKMSNNVRNLLLIFTKQQIQRNKHLMQILSKQVSVN